MKKLESDELHLISRHSNLTEQDINRLLKENIYCDRVHWQKFFHLLFIALGIGFSVTGIVFFFAYNWDALHKFAKIGLTQVLLIATTIAALLPGIKATIRNIILTGASALVGVLFAVFGQIYQTGANAYDFFLVWTIFVSLWVCISNFPPLWLLYLALINTTIVLYTQQVAVNWTEGWVCILLFSINSVILIAASIAGKDRIPQWFLNTIALASASIATYGIVLGIFDRHQTHLPLLLVSTAVAFALVIWHAFKKQSTFYIALVSFCTIIIVSAWIIDITEQEMAFLPISLFIIAGISATIKLVIDLQKKWRNEK